MCGICAIYSYGGDSPLEDAELLAMRDHMTPRGPDGEGVWWSEDRTLGLGHRRLSIIDLTQGGAQPMESADGRFVISYNGEIYNYLELRAEAEAAGHRFRSTSDTEVILERFARVGNSVFCELRGMFAIAIFDRRKKVLTLARDPFGIKPLYYSDAGGVFRLASQVKAMRAGGQLQTSPDPAGRVGFFLWGHVPEPFTLFREIRALPAGAWMEVGPSGAGITRSFVSIPDRVRQQLELPESGRVEHPQARFADVLRDSVRHHLIADVPVGVFLSAGLDSTTLAALAASEEGDIHTVTLAFDEFRDTPDDEAPLAEETAARLGARHRTVRVTRNDFRAQYERLLEAMDQPTTDGVNGFFVSYAARVAGLKVAISGLGGDEMFGGYPSFRQVPKLAGVIGNIPGHRILGRGFRHVAAPLLKRWTSPKYAGLLEYGGTVSGAYLLRKGMYMPWEIPAILDPDLVREGWNELRTLDALEGTASGIDSDRWQVGSLELSWFMRNQLLRDTDWASMAHSLEVRVPFLDLPLLDAVLDLSRHGWAPGKRDIPAAAEGALPAEVLTRRKTGFFIPVQEWILAGEGADRQRGLRGWAKEVYCRQLQRAGETV